MSIFSKLFLGLLISALPAQVERYGHPTTKPLDGWNNPCGSPRDSTIDLLIPNDYHKNPSKYDWLETTPFISACVKGNVFYNIEAYLFVGPRKPYPLFVPFGDKFNLMNGGFIWWIEESGVIIPMRPELGFFRAEFKTPLIIPYYKDYIYFQALLGYQASHGFYGMTASWCWRVKFQ